MSAPARRPLFTLFLLVITPVALLAWLGTYLVRDAAQSGEQIRNRVVNERLKMIETQLLQDLRGFTEVLNKFSGFSSGISRQAAAANLKQHRWVENLWTTELPMGEMQWHGSPPSPEHQKLLTAYHTYLKESLGTISQELTKASSLQPSPFIRVHSTAQSAIKGPVVISSPFFYLGDTFEKKLPQSGWLMEAGTYLYWQKRDNELLVAQLQASEVWRALADRVTTFGADDFQGILTLTPSDKEKVRKWGTSKASPPESSLESVFRLSPPLSDAVLCYNPAPSEFPKPFLFPILLGVSSGLLLVGALAWTFFRESSREIRVAQQRVSFVNQISHELKTPLTNIRLYTELASKRLEEAADAIGVRHLSVVDTEVSRLDRLIQNVLNYARQQKDRLYIQPKSLQLDPLIQRVAEQWRVNLERKGFTLELDLKSDITLKADADAITQILGNLLSNVEKYASQGKWVRIRTEHQTDFATALIIVEDKGPGIPVAKQNSIFEPFERLRSDLNEGVSGTGIGLTISRELAGLHDGTLLVDDHYKQGARFILTLPIASRTKALTRPLTPLNTQLIPA